MNYSSFWLGVWLNVEEGLFLCHRDHRHLEGLLSIKRFVPYDKTSQTPPQCMQHQSGDNLIIMIRLKFADD